MTERRHSCDSPECVTCNIPPVPRFGEALSPDFEALFEETFAIIKDHKFRGVKSLRMMMRAAFYAGTFANRRDLRADPDPALPEDVAEAVRAVQGELFSKDDQERASARSRPSGGQTLSGHADG